MEQRFKMELQGIFTVYNQKSRRNRIVVINYCFLVVEIHSWLFNNLKTNKQSGLRVAFKVGKNTLNGNHEGVP